jgi:hypothetical protein
MAVISNSTLIECSPEEAFDYFVDIRNELEWNSDAVSMEKLTDGPIGKGTRFRAKWKSSKHIEVECVEYDRPVRWVHVNGGPVAVTFTARVEPVGDQTRLLVDFDARPKGLFRVVFPIFLVIMRRQEKANMVNARLALERRLARTGGQADAASTQ